MSKMEKILSLEQSLRMSETRGRGWFSNTVFLALGMMKAGEQYGQVPHRDKGILQPRNDTSDLLVIGDALHLFFSKNESLPSRNGPFSGLFLSKNGSFPSRNGPFPQRNGPCMVKRINIWCNTGSCNYDRFRLGLPMNSKSGDHNTISSKYCDRMQEE